MRSCVLLLIFAVLANGNQFIDNEKIDALLVKTNGILRHYELTSMKLPPGKLIENITFSNITLLGLDSLYRTEDCLKIVHPPTTKTYELHFGFRMMTFLASNLTIDGQGMSAYLRIRNNSIHVKVSLYHDDDCWTSLQALEVERIAGLEFGSSVAAYDGVAVGEDIASALKKLLNELLWIERPKIATFINAWVCGYW